eukprot:gene2056-1562_t
MTLKRTIVSNQKQIKKILKKLEEKAVNLKLVLLDFQVPKNNFWNKNVHLESNNPLEPYTSCSLGVQFGSKIIHFTNESTVLIIQTLSFLSVNLPPIQKNIEEVINDVTQIVDHWNVNEKFSKRYNNSYHFTMELLQKGFGLSLKTEKLISKNFKNVIHYIKKYGSYPVSDFSNFFSKEFLSYIDNNPIYNYLDLFYSIFQHGNEDEKHLGSLIFNSIKSNLQTGKSKRDASEQILKDLLEKKRNLRRSDKNLLDSTYRLNNFPDVYLGHDFFWTLPMEIFFTPESAQENIYERIKNDLETKILKCSSIIQNWNVLCSKYDLCGKKLIKKILLETMKKEEFDVLYPNEEEFPLKEEILKNLGHILDVDLKKTCFYALFEYDNFPDIYGMQNPPKYIQTYEKEENMIFKSKIKIGISIGIEQYDTWKPLNCCKNDAKEIDKILKSMKFDSKPHINLKHKRMTSIIQNTLDTLKDDTLLFFYYSGHGLEQDGCILIFGTDEIPLNLHECLINPVKKSGKSITLIVVLDCCRTNGKKKQYSFPNENSETKIKEPFSLKKSVIREYKKMETSEPETKNQTIVVYATDPGEESRTSNQYSVFTGSLIQYLNNNENFEKILKRTTDYIQEKFEPSPDSSQQYPSYKLYQGTKDIYLNKQFF